MASCNNGLFIGANCFFCCDGSSLGGLIKTSNTRMSIIMMKALLFAGLILIGPSLAAQEEQKQKPDTRKEIHLAGIFPINGVEGWQGGQVILIHIVGTHLSYMYLLFSNTSNAGERRTKVQKIG